MLLGELATPPGEASSAQAPLFERFWASNTFGSSPYAIYLTTNVTTNPQRLFDYQSLLRHEKAALARAARG